MSINQQFRLVVRGFDSPDVGREVLKAVQFRLLDEGMQDDVFSDLMGDLTNLRVVAYTSRPVIISHASVWRPKFEERVIRDVQRKCPTAVLQFDWDSGDEP